MTTFHQFDPSQFAALSRGDGGPEAIAALRRAQLSRHHLLIDHLLRHWPGTSDERDAVADTLNRVRRAAPETLARVLGSPLVGSWTGIVVRAAERGVAVAPDFGQLCGIAAVAAAAAGVPADLPVPVREGAVCVPGRGVLMLSPSATARLVAVSGELFVVTEGHRIHLPSGEDKGTVSGWLPVRRLSAPGGPGVALDDVDPYRHGHHAPPASRLDDARLAHWQSLFTEAWAMLARRLPGRAAELAVGLETLVPLAETDTRSARSATIRYAFGAFGLTCPPTAAEFVVTMVHEFQHSKLSGMLDLAELTMPGDTRRFFAPWRTDPRPLAGLLQGVYAFVGVADAWRALREEETLASIATARFAEARIQVDLGLSSVEASNGLTETGELVAAGLRERTNELLAEPLDAQAVLDAEHALAATQRRWVDSNQMAVPAR